MGTLPEVTLAALAEFACGQATDLFGSLIHTSQLNVYSYVCFGPLEALRCVNSGEIQSAIEQYIA